jgi:hypothetical protein
MPKSRLLHATLDVNPDRFRPLTDKRLNLKGPQILEHGNESKLLHQVRLVCAEGR